MRRNFYNDATERYEPISWGEAIEEWWEEWRGIVLTTVFALALIAGIVTFALYMSGRARVERQREYTECVTGSHAGRWVQIARDQFICDRRGSE